LPLGLPYTRSLAASPARSGRVARSLSLSRSDSQRGQQAGGTVLRTGREVERSRGQGAEWSRAPDGRDALMRCVL